MATVVTDAAKEALRATLEANRESEEQIIRLGSNHKGAVGLTLDVARDDDEVFDYAGEKVFVIGPELRSTLDGATIDVQDSDEGPRLNIRLRDEEDEEAGDPSQDAQ